MASHGNLTRIFLNGRSREEKKILKTVNSVGTEVVVSLPRHAVGTFSNFIQNIFTGDLRPREYKQNPN